MNGKLSELLARVSEEHVVPAVAAANVAGGEVDEIAVHGWRDLERRVPMTADTPSRWYSISKPLTTLALAQLVVAGKLKWEDRVAALVPGVQFADPVATERATVADCLLHRTGLISGDWTWFGAPPVATELLQRLPHVPGRPGFRAGHYYQNLHFTILGEVFKAAGTDWHRAMHDLLEPLGIKPLTRLSEFVAADRALGYGPNGFAPPVRAADFDFEAIAPASAVCGSITELAQVARMMARAGEGVLPARTWAEVTQPVLALGAASHPEWRVPCVALAGRTVVYRGELTLQWAGGFRGYTSHVLAIPSRRIAACALSTRTSCNAAEALAWSLLDRAAGWDPAPWAERFIESKRAMRRAGEKRLASRWARPSAPWPASEAEGRFVHPGYGELVVTRALQLQFREVKLPLVPRPDGSVSAEGSHHGGEIFWELRPEIAGKKVVAWLFNPDDASAPCRFVRC